MQSVVFKITYNFFYSIVSFDLLCTRTCTYMYTLYGLTLSKSMNFFFTSTCSYHPLLPAFRREDHSNIPGPATQTTPTTTTSGKASPSTTRAVGANGTSSGGSDGRSILVQSKDELTDVNLDLVHALDIDFHHAMLPARPDILLLPSDLKPFAKVHSLSLSPSLPLSLPLSLSAWG